MNLFEDNEHKFMHINLHPLKKFKFKLLIELNSFKFEFVL